MSRGTLCAPSGPALRALLLALAVTAVMLAGCVDDEPEPATMGGDEDGATNGDAKSADTGGNEPSAGSTQTGSAPTSASPPNETAPQPVFVSRKAAEIAWSGCREYVSSVPTTAAAFADQLPEGFSIRATDPAGLLTEIVMWYRYCPTVTFVNSISLGEEDVDHHAELWTAVPVDAPADMVAGDADADYWPITWTVDGAQVLDNYFAWGMSGFARPGTAEVFHDLDANPLLIDGVLMEHDAGRYRWAIALGDTGAVPAPESVRVWVPTAGGTPGAVLIERGNGTTGGEGAGYIRQSGDDTFPTLMPLQAVFVDGVDVRTRFLAAS